MDDDMEGVCEIKALLQLDQALQPRHMPYFGPAAAVRAALLAPQIMGLSTQMRSQRKRMSTLKTSTTTPRVRSAAAEADKQQQHLQQVRLMVSLQTCSCL
jgi:hypothetical protein